MYLKKPYHMKNNHIIFSKLLSGRLMSTDYMSHGIASDSLAAWICPVKSQNYQELL